MPDIVPLFAMVYLPYGTDLQSDYDFFERFKYFCIYQTNFHTNLSILKSFLSRDRSLKVI